MQELDLIKISEDPAAKVKSYLAQMRQHAAEAPDPDEITQIVEEVRSERYAGK